MKEERQLKSARRFIKAAWWASWIFSALVWITILAALAIGLRWLWRNA